jgi:YfiH family protein
LRAPGFSLRDASGFPVLVSERLEAEPVLRHWFTTRRGGRSRPPYDELNLGYASGDDRETVEANRTALWRALNLPHPPLLPRQVHGDAVAVVDEGGAAAFLSDPPAADAVVTAARGVPLGVLTADCPPVILLDRRTPALGVVHAGWRGMVRSAVWKTLLTMFERYGTRPEDCAAAVGPCIAGRCYEVGEDVRTAFVKGLPYGQDLLEPIGEGKWLADLQEASRRQLLDGRIPAGGVSVCPICTHCEPAWFYSARRDGAASGRQAAVAMLA